MEWNLKVALLVLLIFLIPVVAIGTMEYLRRLEMKKTREGDKNV